MKARLGLKLLTALLIGCSPITVAANPLEDPLEIYVVTWRGITAAEEGFMSYIKERGIDARFVHRDAERDAANLPGIIEEIRRQQPDLVYAFGTTITVELTGTEDAHNPRDHITDIPVIFNIVADPQGAGIASDLRGTGRNVSGASHLVPIETQFNAMRALDDFQTVGAIYNPLEANSALSIRRLEELVAAAGINMVSIPVPTEDGSPKPGAVADVVRQLAAAEVEIVYLPSDSFIISNARVVVDAIHSYGIPTFSATESPIREAGALIGIVSNYFTVGRFAGYKAEQILLQGLHPGAVPIETLAHFTFLVNLPSMRMLGRYPPVTVLQFAEVIEGSLETKAVEATP